MAGASPEERGSRGPRVGGGPLVALTRLGCRVNQADADVALDAVGAVEASGSGAAGGGGPQVVVVSTCAVTADAESASFQAVRRAAREHAGLPVVVCGCLGALKARELERIEGVAAVIGAGDAGAIAAAIRDACGARRSPSGADAPVLGARARPVLKIQDGCDERCAYCVVPLARGGARSLPRDEVLRRIADLAQVADEVVLAGVHLGAWGADSAPRRGGAPLAGLLELVARRRLVRRVRLSSIEPLEFPLEALAGAAAEVLCAGFHLPIQSGSDRVLAAMRRPYRAADAARVIGRIAAAMPAASIGADLMTGFPGETGADHRETVALVRDLPLTALHVFPFSPREGTAAASMPRQVPAEVARERAAELRELSDAAWRAFVDRQRGRDVEAVVERVAAGVARGTTREGVLARWSAPAGPGAPPLVRGRAVVLRALAREGDALRCDRA